MDGVLAIFTASDTTATVLSNIFWNLLRYPHYYQRLQTEVDKYYPADADVLDTKHYSKMTLLDAVMCVGYHT